MTWIIVSIVMLWNCWRGCWHLIRLRYHFSTWGSDLLIVKWSWIAILSASNTCYFSFVLYHATLFSLTKLTVSTIVLCNYNYIIFYYYISFILTWWHNGVRWILKSKYVCVYGFVKYKDISCFMCNQMIIYCSPLDMLLWWITAFMICTLIFSCQFEFLLYRELLPRMHLMLSIFGLIHCHVTPRGMTLHVL